MKDTSINSDCPEEYNSASEECDNEIVDEIVFSSPAQSDQNDLEAESGSQLSQAGSSYGSEDTESEARSPPPPRERRKKSHGNSLDDQDKNTRYKNDSFVLEHPRTSKRLPLPEFRTLGHESQIKFTVAGRTEPLKHFMLETLLSIQLKKISLMY